MPAAIAQPWPDGDSSRGFGAPGFVAIRSPHRTLVDVGTISRRSGPRRSTTCKARIVALGGPRGPRPPPVNRAPGSAGSRRGGRWASATTPARAGRGAPGPSTARGHLRSFTNTRILRQLAVDLLFVALLEPGLGEREVDRRESPSSGPTVGVVPARWAIDRELGARAETTVTVTAWDRPRAGPDVRALCGLSATGRHPLRDALVSRRVGDLDLVALSQVPSIVSGDGPIRLVVDPDDRSGRAWSRR